MPVDRSRNRVGLLSGADLGPGASGGTRSYVIGLARFLVRRGIGVRVFSNGPADGLPTDCVLTPVTSLHLHSSRAFQRALRSWSRTYDLEGIDLIHLQKPDDFLSIRHVRARPPAVCTLHGNPRSGVRRRKGIVAALAYGFLEARAFPSLAAAIAVDPVTAAEYRSRYPGQAERIYHIPTAVDDGWMESDPGSAHLVGSDQPTFLYVGRLSVEKRVGAIIEALRRTKLSDPVLKIIGTGREEAKLRRLANGSSVEFLGGVRHDDLLRYYRQAHALVFASEFEGLPTAALEALSCGCPVVALRGCGLERLLENGNGVIAEDLAALPAALERVVELRNAGVNVSLPSEFLWSRAGERVLDVYRTAAPGAF